MQVFVTGTDTDVGKTVVTAGLAAVMQSLGYKVGVYKPFQSGAVEQNGFLKSPDLSYVKKMDFYVETMSTYLLKAPTAPLVAAQIENIEIDIQNVQNDFLRLKEYCEFTIVEGAGGIMVPITEDKLMIDIIKMLNIPIVIVTRPDLGTINHTLLTVNQAKAYGLNIVGIIINKYPKTTQDVAIKTAPILIEEFSGVKVLGVVPEIKNLDTLNPGELINIMINNIDIESVFRIKIPKLNF